MINLLVGALFKEQATKTDSIQSAVVLSLNKQTDAVDYYSVEIDGEYFDNVPCALPSWLLKQLQLENVMKGLLYSPENRRVSIKREPLFLPGESVEVTFEGGNKHMPKISIESSRKKYEPMEIVYI